MNTTENATMKKTKMKKIIYGLLLISSSLITKAQQKTGAIFHLGCATSTIAKFMVDAGGGYMFKGATMEASIIVAHLDNNMEHPAYFMANAGYEIQLSEKWSVTPTAGAGYRMFTTDSDKKHLNGFVASIGGRIKFRDVYFGAMRAGNTTFLSIGISGLFND